jgi:hypothetical protein
MAISMNMSKTININISQKRKFLSIIASSGGYWSVLDSTDAPKAISL